MTRYDVIVCGGGPTGTAAAIAAARSGAKVLLLERYGFTGGMATGALVNPWAGHEFPHPDEPRRTGSLIGGLFKEINAGLAESGGYGSAMTPSAFDDERLKFVYDRLLLEAGVDVQYHTLVTGVDMDGERVAAVHASSKQGAQRFAPAVVVDSTGDGDIAAFAGCEWTLGRPQDQLTQAMTVSFRVGNVDKEAMVTELMSGDLTGVRSLHKPARLLVEPYFQKALAEGRLHFPYREWVHFYDYPRPGVLHFNMTRVNRVNGLSAADLTRAEMEGRRQAVLFTDWLIRDVPYFRNAYLEKIACQVGVRETRHVKGLYWMTGEDITSARKFEDAIVRSRYAIDIHSPTGSGFEHEVKGQYGAFKQSYDVPKGDYYEVPYRAIVPERVGNLLVACRALSASHEASAAIRVMATMTGIGEAAGIAAAKAAQDRLPVQQVDGRWLRGRLGYLDEAVDYGSPWNP